MRPLIAAGDMDALEDPYRRACADADPGLSRQIADLELASWGADLGWASVLARPSSPDIAAVYWEFDPDNGWQNAFFGCGRYRPEADGEDDWAADVLETTPGPGNSQLAVLYDPSFDGTEFAIAGNLFLFARTFAEFVRATRSAWPERLPLCAGFHDQDSVFRVVNL